jgi:hypothetical protein
MLHPYFRVTVNMTYVRGTRMLPVAEGRDNEHVMVGWTSIPDGQNRKCRSPEQPGGTTLKHTLKNQIMKIGGGGAVVFSNYFW